MTQYQNKAEVTVDVNSRENLVRILSLAIFLIMFQVYMVAPLIPQFSTIFQVSEQEAGLMIPAYLIPYGVSTLLYGWLSDFIGRGRVVLASMIAFTIFVCLTATSFSLNQMLMWRFLTGMTTSGVVPLALALIGDLFPYEQRGRPLGWLFGAVAGGTALGSSFGVIMEPILGWRGLFLLLGSFSVGIVCLLLKYWRSLNRQSNTTKRSISEAVVGYARLISFSRGRYTYFYILLNAAFQSGVFTWLGWYFAQVYKLNEVGIGLAIIGYGVPGFFLGPIIGKAADRWGRRWLIPVGLGISSIAAAVLIFKLSLPIGIVAVTILSLGHDMTQPLLTGIVTDLSQDRSGQAMALNTFSLFTGFGIGSFLFGQALVIGFDVALIVFCAVQMLASLMAVYIFRYETHVFRK